MNISHKAYGRNDTCRFYFYTLLFRFVNFIHASSHGDSILKCRAKDLEISLSFSVSDQITHDDKFLYIKSYSEINVEGLCKDLDTNDINISDSLFEGADIKANIGDMEDMIIVPIINFSFFECDFDLNFFFDSNEDESVVVDKEHILDLINLCCIPIIQIELRDYEIDQIEA